MQNAIRRLLIWGYEHKPIDTQSHRYVRVTRNKGTVTKEAIFHPFDDPTIVYGLSISLLELLQMEPVTLPVILDTLIGKNVV